eukprot:CAMPEP_0168479836 /NCGR_PEP_ID=MMETSP0228-20121227/63676_1 /TAXON_ID=133427 /ORGANISM="Protoceratium reticulatum, Strain CCCM 535 (=CCMP 1889)" /LENGTH=95 /DNA_ID=CAMNT_0008496135 /DNA_START=1 /DNA_END=285 /DNA_ORIENTATION=-
MVLLKPAAKASRAAKKTGKAKKVCKVATGKFAKVLVFGGRREKTVGGLRAEGLVRNKRGKIVSKRRSADGRRRFGQVRGWIEALMEARRALHITG